MKIVIDASCLILNRYSGLSEVVHNLLLRLPQIEQNYRFDLFINYFRTTNAKKNIVYPGTVSQYCRAPRRLMAWWWRTGWPPIDFYLAETDIYHSLHVQIPPTRKIKTVLTVHDCRYAALPELYTPKQVENYRRQMKTSLERADMVAAVSEFTRREVLTYFSFPEDRIRVIYNGFESSWRKSVDCREKADSFRAKNNLPPTYLLYVGALDPRKNLGRLIEAVAQCKAKKKDFPELLIAGISNAQWAASGYSGGGCALGLGDYIHLCGSVEKDVLIGLAQKAQALCYPSVYEGFGFPPLEAMSVGVPVLAGNRSSIPEVVGPAACLVNPFSTEEIAQGLNRIVFDSEYRQNLIDLGHQQVNRYSWLKAAAEYIALYKEVVA